MPVLPAPTSEMHTPSATTPPRTSGRAAPKLRDSCQACASSKVKCHKEKPRCSRCAKRGIVCEYQETRRAGRTSYKKQAADAGKKASGGAQKSRTGNDPILVAGLSDISTDSWFTLDAFATANEVNPSTSQPFCSLNTASNGSPTLFGDVGNLEPALSSSLNELSTLDDYLDFATSSTAVSPTSTGPQVSDANGFSFAKMEGVELCRESSRSSYDLNSFISNDAYAGVSGDCFSLLDPSLTTGRSNSTTTATGSPQPPCRSSGSGEHDSSYTSCLPRALDLLKRLAPTPVSPCPMSGGGLQDNAGAHAPPTIHTVIANNRQTIEAVRSMLECPCSSDNFLTMVLTLVICKVFGWYAAAARGPVSSRSGSIGSSGSQSPVEHVHREPVVVGSYCLDGDDSAYMAGQLVLSELHRVQRIVNQLSMRLTGQSSSPCSETREVGSGARPDSKYNEAFSTSLFSAPLLHQFERDLRKGLKRLSLETVRELEREFSTE